MHGVRRCDRSAAGHVIGVGSKSSFLRQRNCNADEPEITRHAIWNASPATGVPVRWLR